MKIETNWTVGFVDGEGCFRVTIIRCKEISTGFQVLPEFTVLQHKQDVQILYALKTFFGCGVVRKNHDDWMCYRVREIEHLLKIIIPFFEKHELKTKKRIDFQKFRKILLKMQRSDHLTADGIEEIREINNQMNRFQTKIESDSYGNIRD